MLNAVPFSVQPAVTIILQINIFISVDLRLDYCILGLFDGGRTIHTISYQKGK